MNNLNNIKLVFATTLCSYFLQWILLFVVPVCLCRCLSHDTCTLIPDWCTVHNVSLQEFGEYLIFATFNETLLMRPASLLTLVSNYLNRQTILLLHV